MRSETGRGSQDAGGHDHGLGLGWVELGWAGSECAGWWRKRGKDQAHK